MRPDILIERLLENLDRDRLLLRRIAYFLLPLLMFPVGFAVAQIGRSWFGLVTGGIGAIVLLVQAGLTVQPILARTRTNTADVAQYLGLDAGGESPPLAAAAVLAAPTALSVLLSMVLFGPAVLAGAALWQRLLALVVGLASIWVIWRQLSRAVASQSLLAARLTAAREPAPPVADVRPAARKSEPLLDPAIRRRVAGMPLLALSLSPAAIAALRVEAYLLLHDDPGRNERELLEGLHGLARELHADECQHDHLPPVGGKIYLPISANGVTARSLAATARALGMDGAYSATLGTWLVRLPPARSYRVAGRLIDAILALGILPAGAVLPHHLTVQGDLGADARDLSLLHLASSPLIMSARPGASRDERPFIMRGGGVLDDMSGRGRLTGQRTDFVDGFLLVGAEGFDDVEHLTAHTLNLRIKQVLAFGLRAYRLPSYRRAPLEAEAAELYGIFRDGLRAFLVCHELQHALEIDWLDGRWSEIWPIIEQLNQRKEAVPAFVDEAQALCDAALDALEDLAVRATGVRR